VFCLLYHAHTFWGLRSPPQLGAHYLQPIAELAAEFIPDADDADSVEPDTAFFFALVQGLNDCVQKLEARRAGRG
jgi:hypothetical protein